MRWDKDSVYAVSNYREITIDEVQNKFTKNAQAVLAFHPMTESYKVSSFYSGIEIRLLK